MDGQSSSQRARTGTRSSITPGRTGTVRQRQEERDSQDMVGQSSSQRAGTGTRSSMTPGRTGTGRKGQSGYGWTVLLTEGRDRDKKLHDTR